MEWNKFTFPKMNTSRSFLVCQPSLKLWLMKKTNNRGHANFIKYYNINTLFPQSANSFSRLIKAKKAIVRFFAAISKHIMRKTLLLSFISILAAGQIIAQPGTVKSINNAILQTPAQQLIASTGEDSLNSYGGNHSRTVISGYGEVAYERDVNAQQSIADLKRAILCVGHQFTGKIAFFSELEVEDATVEGGGVTGEVAMEQAYLKFSLNPRQYIVAGLLLPRIGIINENHLPINFNGVERPFVEQLIIPSTWREIGVGFYGQTTALPFTYSVALLNGLDNAHFEHGTGIEGARAEGQNANANSLAITAAVQYFAGNWKFQASGYMSGTTPLRPRAADSLQLESGAFGSPLYLAEADVQYNNKGITLKALACNVSLPKAERINKAYSGNVPMQMSGAYAELGYNLLQTAKNNKWKNKQLIVFARYEMLDVNAKIPANGIIDETLKQTHLTAGLGYFPIPNVVIKADVRLLHTGDENTSLVINPNPNAAPYNQNNTFLNLCIGYSF